MYPTSDDTYTQIKYVLENFNFSGYIFGQTEWTEREREHWATGELFQAFRAVFFDDDEYEVWADHSLAPTQADIVIHGEGRSYVFELKRASQWSSISRLEDQISRYTASDDFTRGYVVVLDDRVPTKAGEDPDGPSLDQIIERVNRNKWEVWVYGENDSIWHTGKPLAQEQKEVYYKS